MSSYRLIRILANQFVAQVQARYRPATPDEVPFALSTDDAVGRIDRPRDAETIPATVLAAITLDEVSEHWVPRTDALSADAKDDIETLAEIIARKAIVGYEPVPYAIATEFEIASGISSNSRELVADSIKSAEFTATAVYELVFDRACALLDSWNGEAGLWWTVELPFDGDPPLTIISTEKDAPF
jgi:hypothetical protein